VRGPAAVNGQDDASEVAGLRVSEHECGAGQLVGGGPPADRDLGGQEMPYLRVVVCASVQRGPERAGGECVDRDPGPGEFNGQAARELHDGALLAA
jgi:hypothetical protein